MYVENKLGFFERLLCWGFLARVPINFPISNTTSFFGSIFALGLVEFCWPSMFDWKAELAPVTFAAIATASHLPVAAIESIMPHAAVTFLPPVQAAIPKPSFAQALHGSLVQSEPLPMPSIRGEHCPLKLQRLLITDG